jgi:hypothetical protein
MAFLAGVLFLPIDTLNCVQTLKAPPKGEVLETKEENRPRHGAYFRTQMGMLEECY